MEPLTPQQALAKADAAGRCKAALTADFTPRGIVRMTLSGALAGAFIALGGLLSLLVGQGFPELAAGNPGLPRLLSGAMFPLGLILVVFMGAELFTGNNALLVPSWADGVTSTRRVLTNWGIVYITNFLGAIAFTLLLAWASGVTDAPVYRDAAVNISTTKVSLPWMVVLVRGIGANWLVCLAVWLGLTCTTPLGRMAGLWFPVMAFVAMGMEHSIANMFYLPLGMLHGADFTVADALWRNLLPATIGNILGGALFVAMPLRAIHRKP